MPQLTEEFWNNRWKNGETGWDIGYASPAIVSYFKSIKDRNASILIPGCGNAYEAEALLELGFEDITILDISAVAIRNLQEKFHLSHKIHVVHADFLDHHGKYDIMVEQTFFCALLPNKRTDYVKKTHQILSDDGMLTGLLFNREFAHEGPPYGGNREEYIRLFSPYFKIQQLETAKNSIPQRAGKEIFIEFKKKIV